MTDGARSNGEAKTPGRGTPPSSQPTPTSAPETSVDLRADELLTAEEAAAIFKVKSRTLLAWARAGRVPCIVLGPRTIRFTRTLLLDYAASRTEPGRPF